MMADALREEDPRQILIFVTKSIYNHFVLCYTETDNRYLYGKRGSIMDINLDMEKEALLESDLESEPEFEELDMNLDKKRCPICDGVGEIIRFDENHIYYKCKHCGEPFVHTFTNQEEAEVYIADAKWKLFAELNEGLLDWRMTNWDRIRDDFIRFVNYHPYLENDLIFQMGILACETKGFNMMELSQYRQTRARFKRIDKIYKQRLKFLKAQMKNPVLSESMESYRLSRTQYVELKNQYLQTKMIIKVFWGILKKLGPFK